MPDSEIWRKLDELGKDVRTDIRNLVERIVRIETGGGARDEKLDAVEAAVTALEEKMDAKLDVIVGRLNALAKLADDAQTAARFAGIFTRTGWGIALTLGWVVSTYWPTLKKWLP